MRNPLVGDFGEDHTSVVLCGKGVILNLSVCGEDGVAIRGDGDGGSEFLVGGIIVWVVEFSGLGPVGVGACEDIDGALVWVVLCVMVWSANGYGVAVRGNGDRASKRIT